MSKYESGDLVIVNLLDPRPGVVLRVEEGGRYRVHYVTSSGAVTTETINEIHLSPRDASQHKGHAYAVGDIVNIDLPSGHSFLRGQPNHARKIVSLTFNGEGDPSYILDNDKDQWGEYLIKQLTNEKEKNMEEPKYKVGDVVNLRAKDAKKDTLPDRLLMGMSRENRKIVGVRPPVFEGAGFRYSFSDLPEQEWNEFWIDGLSNPEPETKLSVEDRVKFKYSRKAGTVVGIVPFGAQEGRVLVEWDKEYHILAENAEDLVLLHSPSAEVEVDEELVAHLNDERQRLIRIIESATKELRPVTKKWEEAKSGKVVDGS